MALHSHKSAGIIQGWVRALLLLLVYTAVSSVLAIFIQSLALWLIGTSLAAILLVYLFRLLIDRRRFIDIGLARAGFYPDAWIGLIAAPLVLITGTLLIYTFQGIVWTGMAFRADDLMFMMVMLFIVAIAEEIVFRGYVLRNLLKSFDKWASLAISAVIFAFFHTSNNEIQVVGFINVALGGLLVGLSYIHTGNLWFPTFFHFSWNFFQGPVLGFPVSGFPFDSVLKVKTTGSHLINGGDFGFEGSVICTILLSALFIFACRLHLKQLSEETGESI